MSPALWMGIIAGCCAAIAVAAGAYWWVLRQRSMHLWLSAYYFTPRPKANRLKTDASTIVAFRSAKVRPFAKRKGEDATVTPAPVHTDDKPLHVFIAVCDHYEPEWGRPARSTSVARVQRWVDEYPRLFGQFQDSTGRPPQHTYFYPQDEYRPEYLDLLTELVQQGLGDVDIHLHHDGDTADSLRQKLDEFKHTLHERHGLLRRDPITNELVYGFIHGNWALCNSRPDRKWCGVDQELTVLRETGCYADFTLPSAPSDTQIRIVNSIYYAQDIPGRCGSHNWGTLARVGQAALDDHLLMIQGALLPDWRHRRLGIFPRIENSDLHGGRPPTWERFRDWTRAGVHVAGRPDWLFVKLHTHGCKDANIDTWLGPQTQQFHADLAAHARQQPNFQYHYVTAWEMAQLVHQAERGVTTPQWNGSLVSSPLGVTV